VHIQRLSCRLSLKACDVWDYVINGNI